jgi:mRNA interferase HigB
LGLIPKREQDKKSLVQITARRALRVFWEAHPQAEQPLKTWYAMVARAEWKRPQDVKAQFSAAVDFIVDNRVVFDISGNKYRLIVRVAYRYRRVLIKFVGTHAEYDKVDAATV